MTNMYSIGYDKFYLRQLRRELRWWRFTWVQPYKKDHLFIEQLDFSLPGYEIFIPYKYLYDRWHSH